NAILRFFASELPRLQKDWEVRIGERFGHVTAKVDRVRPVVSTRESLEPGWLDVDLGFSSDSDVSLSRQEIQRLLQVGQSHTRLPNGRIAAVDLEACEDLNEVLRDVNPDQRYGSL